LKDKQLAEIKSWNGESVLGGGRIGRGVDEDSLLVGGAVGINFWNTI
jgi:hypothetical protein